MSIKSVIGKLYANILVSKLRKTVAEPIKWQEHTLQTLLRHGRDTEFGKAHNFDKISKERIFQSIEKEIREISHELKSDVLSSKVDFLKINIPAFHR